MAFRMRNFIRIQNIFCAKNLRLEQGIFQKSHIRLFGTESKTSSFSKAALIVGGLGVSGGLYGYLAAPDRKYRNEGKPLNEQRDYVVKNEIPYIVPSRQIQGPANLNLEFTLYQYQNCPFCCKVRAFLDYYGIPYNVIEVNPVMRKQLKFSEYKKVPILIVEDKKSSIKYQLNDSSVIISILSTFLLDVNNSLENVLKLYVPFVYQNEEGKKIEEVLNSYFIMYGEKKVKKQIDEQLSNERKWRQWADKHLVHILSPNVYRTFDEAIESFEYFSKVGEWEKNFSTTERLFVIYVGAAAMYLISKRLKKRHSLKDDVRQSLYDACNQWTKAIGSKRKFLGGDIPNLADLAIYGLLNSIEGCSAFQDLKDNTSIATWYYNVKEAISNHSGYKLLEQC